MATSHTSRGTSPGRPPARATQAASSSSPGVFRPSAAFAVGAAGAATAGRDGSRRADRGADVGNSVTTTCGPSGRAVAGSSGRTWSRIRCSSRRSAASSARPGSRSRAASTAARSDSAGSAIDTRIDSGPKAGGAGGGGTTASSGSRRPTSAGVLAPAAGWRRTASTAARGRGGSTGVEAAGSATATVTTAPFTNETAVRTLSAMCRSWAIRRARSGSAATGSASAASGPV